MNITHVVSLYNGTLVSLPTGKAARSASQATRRDDERWDVKVSLDPQRFAVSDEFGWHQRDENAVFKFHSTGKTMGEIYGVAGSLSDMLADGWVERPGRDACGRIVLERVI